MTKIKIEDKIDIVYKNARDVFLKKITQKEAKNNLAEEGININSASDYIICYSKMARGKCYIRTINNPSLDYYLNRIHNNTPSLLSNALMSLSLHIDYYENKANTTMHTTRSIYEKYYNLINKASTRDLTIDTDEIENHKKLLEGSVKRIYVNSYERNQIARNKCIEKLGCKCSICGFDFEAIYGEIGSGFIHVHHKKEISEVGKEYTIDPYNDLIPVCPNCHAMLHQKKPAYTVDELRRLLNKI